MRPAALDARRKPSWQPACGARASVRPSAQGPCRDSLAASSRRVRGGEGWERSKRWEQRAADETLTAPCAAGACRGCRLRGLPGGPGSRSLTRFLGKRSRRGADAWQSQPQDGQRAKASSWAGLLRREGGEAAPGRGASSRASAHPPGPCWSWRRLCQPHRWDRACAADREGHRGSALPAAPMAGDGARGVR